ncbi:hypothetical protein Psi02_64970 [Planotetraspora silvatica]|uniref:Uncharacterized protein n=1 Tax=Planotetraspora silvatica TaxID=234614 RepID=A0A8J3XV09_9ACTN|nr:hypothetical protein Psi02_64970 [Planotetraspora silvatica]
MSFPVTFTNPWKSFPTTVCPLPEKTWSPVTTVSGVPSGTPVVAALGRPDGDLRARARRASGVGLTFGFLVRACRTEDVARGKGVASPEVSASGTAFPPPNVAWSLVSAVEAPQPESRIAVITIATPVALADLTDAPFRRVRLNAPGRRPGITDPYINALPALGNRTIVTIW